MQRTQRKHLFLAGALGLVLAACILPNTRSLIIGGIEASYIDWRLAQLHPQTGDQLWDAYSQAYKLGSKHFSVFKMNGQRVVRRWTRNADGSLKPWVAPHTERLLITCLTEDPWSEDYTVVFSSGYTADVSWRYQRWRIWLESGLTLISGAIGAWLGVIFLYGLLIAMTAYLLILGKVGSWPTPLNGNSGHSISAVYHGGDESHPIGSDVSADRTPRSGWLVVWVMLGAVTLFDWRAILRTIRTMSPRAPPFRKESVMRLVVGILIAVLISSTPRPSSADNLGLYLGEQLAGIGGAIDATLERGPIAYVPWALLDGSKVEGMVMARYADSRLTFTVGPLLGQTSTAAGARLYYGAEIRGKFRRGPLTLVYRLAERHTRRDLLHRFANLGLETELHRLRYRLAYEPIYRQHVLTNRLAAKVTAPFRGARIGFELRQELNGTGRKSGLAEIIIPLK